MTARGAGGPGDPATAVLEQRVAALEQQVAALAGAMRTLTAGLEETPFREPGDTTAARAARQAREVLIAARLGG
ncbi:hypothetical protein GCM10023085_20640 [Actinomadura viridis]|uniref:Uncharacterized protein n=1 Tax=Actinomadura viridis TaxID=58110 RepID=A0A931GR17_9ACTN|nr:hypothetical protein [Actinomadura viridis]MBG6089179.1 hypothetical protein [Actinomadura viridis]